MKNSRAMLKSFSVKRSCYAFLLVLLLQGFNNSVEKSFFHKTYLQLSELVFQHWPEMGDETALTSGRNFAAFMATCSGNADAVDPSSVGILYSNMSTSAPTGAPDGEYALVHDIGDRLVLDLTDVINAGESYTLTWRRKATYSPGPFADMVIEESLDKVTWTENPTRPSTNLQTFTTTTVSANVDTRYLRIRIETNSSDDFDFDAVAYSSVECGGSTVPANLSCTANSDEISGTAFHDFDYDGLFDTGIDYLGLKGLLVSITDSLNNTISTVTNANGAYSVSGLTTDRTYRVEFIFPDSLDWADVTQEGPDNGTAVQFVTPGECANLGVASPSDYCHADPRVVTPCYINGDPLAGGTTGDFDFIVSVPFNPTGSSGLNEYLADGDEVGTTWGVAYHRESEMILTSAFLKRHSGFGSLGTGGIYKIDMSSGSPVASPYFSLDTDLNINTGTDPRILQPLPADADTPNHDSLAFDLVGKMSIGDIDLSDDEETLWVMNLFDQKLYEIDLPDISQKPTTFTAHSLPNPSCSNGQFRAFATKFHRGKIYIGGVCSAENGGTAANLRGFIYAHDPELPADSFDLVFDFPLNYTRGCVSDCGTCNDAEWNPWVEEWNDITDPAPGGACYDQTIHPQPILADIEFDVDGSIVLGLEDRLGHQTGNNNYSPISSETDFHEGAIGGDILRVHFENGGYTLENNATCGTTTTTGMDNNQGPGGGEYYWQDMYQLSMNPTSGGHHEVSVGGLVLLPGTGEILSPAYDPVTAFRAGGLTWYSNSNGERTKSYQIFGQDFGGQPATFGKASGIGDVEALCLPAPLEIGNLVWLDEDNDGVQDAGEAALKGVRMELYDFGGNLLAFDTTDTNGEYYFSGQGIDDADWLTSNDTIQSKTMYYVVAGGGGQFSGGKLNLGSNGYTITADSTDSGSNRFEIDSDGTIAVGIDSDFDGKPYLKISSGGWGEDDHSADFGFNIIPECEITVVSATPSACNPLDDTYSLEVVVSYSAAPSGLIQVSTSEGAAVSATQTSSPQTITISGLISNGMADINVSAYFADDLGCLHQLHDAYNAPASCEVPCDEECINWGSLPLQDFTVNGTPPVLDQTFTDIFGTGVDMDLSFSNPSRGGDLTQTFGVIQTYTCNTSGNILRYWEPLNGQPDTVKMDFSTQVELYELTVGGYRVLQSGANGIMKIFAYDGPNGTGNLVTPNWTDPNASVTLNHNVPEPLPGNVPINIFSGNHTGTSGSSEPIGTQNVSWCGDHYEAVGTNGNRPWLLLDYNGVDVQSICYVIYSQNSSTPCDGTATLVDANNSVYMGPISFCSSVPPACDIEVTSVTPSACVPVDNSFTADVTLTYSNSPSGNINVFTENGGSASVAQTGSPQTITISGMTANGTEDIDVIAVFANDSSCADTMLAAFTAPCCTSSGMENYSGCINDGYSVTVNGTLYSQANQNGTETIVGGNYLGCDSTVTISLSYKPNSVGSETYNGCSGDGYFVTVDGTLYNESNPTGTETLPSSNGCDSVVTISLLYKPNSVGSETYNGCSGDGYFVTVDGTLYNESNPTGTETLPSSNGCDSTIIINLTFEEHSTNDIFETLCTGSSITVNGTPYNEVNPTGTEVITGGASNGCDSTINVSLTFNSFATNTISENRCQGDGYSVTVNSVDYNESNPSGIETIIGGSYLGCDSVITVNLTFHSPSTSSETYAGCQGDGYNVLVNGTLYNEANSSGTEVLPNANGCDSTVTIALDFAPPGFGTEIRVGCSGDGYSVTVNGITYDESNPVGTEIIIGGTTNGCDSTVVIGLGFNSPAVNQITQSLCTGSSITVNGVVYDESNPSGAETIIGGASNGCDSTIIIELTFNAFASHNINNEGCQGDGYFVEVNGTTYNESNPSGTETIIGGSYLGCDSVITVNLVYLPNASSSLEVTICDGDTYPFDDEMLSISGTYFDTLTAANFCDSIISLNLVVQTAAHFTIQDSICDGDTYFFAGQNFSIPGTYYDTLSYSTGCDSVIAQLLLTEEQNCAQVFDLALEKYLAPGESPDVSIGDTVTFTIEIINEGDFAATNILPIDYVPNGLTWSSALSSGWLDFGAGPTWFIPGPLQPGQSMTRDITFIVNTSATPANLENVAEITNAVSSNGAPDHDSSPNGFQFDDPPSEDDHDGEQLNLQQPILSLGNLVFEDKNNDGIFNNDDAGIEEAEVILYNVGPDGIKNTSDDTVEATKETNGFGGYLFQNLVEGLYYVKLSGVGIPANYISSTGGGIYDNDGMGVYEPATNTDNDIDNDDDGTQMGAMIMSDTIRLTVGGEPGGNQNLTVDFGIYKPLPPPTFDLGNLVFHDKDNDGIFNNDDAGIEEAEVVLYNLGPDGIKGNSDDVALTTEETNGFGGYLFTDLAEGLYYVKLSGAGIPSGFISSTGDGPYDSDGAGAYEPYLGTDNDVDNEDDGSQMGAMVMSDTIRMTIGGEPGDSVNLTVDFGIYKPLPTLSLGNLVFEDLDNDGIYNNADEGMEDVEVVLYDAGPDGLKGTSDDIALDSMTTNGFGEYLFDGLEEGLYYVKISGEGVPNGYLSSTGGGIYDDDGAGAFEPSAGTDNNVDGTDDGSQMGMMIMSDTVRLTIGGEPDGNDNYTVDFGLYEPDTFDLALVKILANGQSSVALPGDTVQFKLGVFNQGTVAAYNLTLRDSLPTNLNFDVDLNSGWSLNFDGTVSYTHPGPLLPDSMAMVALQAIVSSAAVDGDLLINFGEISTADDDQNTGNGIPDDKDSTPDNDMSNDVFGGDDFTDNNNNDEDDHDTEILEVNELPTLTLGNHVFHDKDNDGIFNNDDAGLEEIEVVLYNVGPDGLKGTSDDIALETTETNGFGQYLFSGLTEGLYYVKLSGAGVPTDFVSSTGDGIYDMDGAGAFEPIANTDNNVDGQDDGSQMGAMIMSDTIRLTIGDEPGGDVNLTVDFGLYEPQEIPTMNLGNLVFHDKDNDGIFNNNDVGIEDVETELYGVGPDGLKGTGDDVFVAGVATNGFGEYQYSGLGEGVFYVKLTGVGIPTDYVSSTGGGPHDTDGAGTYEPSFGTDNNVDNEDDGSQMGVMVMSDTIRMTFDNEPGGNVNLTVDFGLFAPQELLSLGNLVFHDKDNDGIFNNNDVGIEDVETELYGVGPDGLKGTGDDVFVAGVATNGFGEYQYSGLGEGVFYVKLSGAGIPTAYISSTGDGPFDNDGAGAYEPSFGTDNNVDNEDDGSQMGAMIMSDTIRLAFNIEPAGNFNPTVDFGLYAPNQYASLGNFVWFDNDHNGQQNSEPGVPNVYVNLFDLGADGMKGGGDDNLLGTDTTDANGAYDFINLEPGDYYVMFDVASLPTNYNPTTQDSGNDQSDSDANLMGMTEVINLSAGENDDSIDFGIEPELASLGDLVWYDNDRNGQQNGGEPGVAEVTVQLFDLGVDGVKGGGDDNLIDTKETNPDGIYNFTNIEPGDYYVMFDLGTLPTNYNVTTQDAGNDATDSDANTMGMTAVTNLAAGENDPSIDMGIEPAATGLGDFVWFDNDHDGQQDGNEPGVPGVIVELYDLGTDGVKGGGDDNLLATDTTNTSGNYGFGGLDPGDYYVMFLLNTLPANYNPTAQNSGDDQSDSDVNAMGMTGVYTLMPGVFNSTIDFGIEPELASLGDLVWYDNDRNGQQNGGEPGVAEVKVQLFDLGVDGVKGGGDDNLIDTKETNTDGVYNFINIEPGDYYVMFDLATLPTGYMTAQQDNGNDATDSDANSMGMTAVTNLAAGENDPTIDMGIEPDYASLGDLVWDDENINGQKDNGEPGVQGIIVNLFDLGTDGMKGGGDDNLLAIDTTGVGGIYGFANLEPGDYYVMFDLTTLPTDYVVTSTDSGNDSSDSDANFMGMTGVYSLSPGESNPTIDMGIYNPMFDLALHKNLSVNQTNMVDIGDDVKYTIRIENQGLISAHEVMITDHIPTGMMLSPNDMLWDSIDINTATYTLNGPILPGQSDSVEIILRVLYGLSSSTLTNVAEVDSAKDENGVTVNDIDSTPDNDMNGEDDQDDEPIVLLEHDPTGFIYCEKTGQVITGGTISVMGPNGIVNDEVAILQDGSTGYYEFFATGLPGIYTITYTHPDGYPMSVTCEEQMGAFDPTGPNDHFFGSEAANGYLIDTACANNMYYLQFDLELGDPNVFRNNLPIQCVYIGSIVCEDVDLNEQNDGTEPPLTGAIVNLYDCADLVNPIARDTTQANGRFGFDGLEAGDYRLQFISPNGYRPIQGAGLDANGFASCITLDFGDCDTTTTACMIPCATVNAGNDATVCFGGTTQLLAAPNYGAGTYLWTPNITLDNNAVANPMASPVTTTTYTVNYDDGLGCTATDDVMVTVAITTPTLAYTPFAGQTVECTAPIPFEAPTFTDICDNNLSITLDSTIVPLTCGYMIQRTWTATNNQGNSLSFVQVVSVVDTTPPTLTASHPLFGALNHGDTLYADCTTVPSFNFMTVNAVDACTNVTTNFTENVVTGNCAADGYIQLMYCGWTAVDTCDNVDSLYFTVVVFDTIAPTLLGVPADVTVSCGSVPAAPAVSASDFCDNLIPVLTENTIVGMNGCDSLLIRTWTATDNCGNVGTASQAISIYDTQAPVLTINHPMMAGVMDGDTLYLECQEIVSLSAADATATDDCCLPTVQFQEFVTAASCPDDGYVQFMTCGYTATDCCGNADSLFFHVFVLDNTPPTLIGVPPNSDIECTGGAPAPPTVYAVDNCADASTLVVNYSADTVGVLITRTWSATDDCGNNVTETQTILLGIDVTGPTIFNVPADTTVSCADGLPAVPGNIFATDDCDPNPMMNMVETPLNDCGGSVIRTWTATDINGNPSTLSQTITVVDNSPPVISGVGPDVNYQCNPGIIANTITVTDNCTANPLVTLNADTTGLSCGYQIVRVYTATDACGNSTMAMQTIIVNDTEDPTLTGVPADLTMSCEQPVPPAANVSANDNCSSNVLANLVETSNGTCPQIITRTWTATDDCGNSTSASQTITIEDNEAPTMVANHPFFGNIEHGDTLFADCTQIASLDSLGFADSDNCSVPVRTFDEMVMPGDCATDGYLELRYCGWTSTDACGNTDSLFFTVVISDLMNPVLVGMPADLTLDCEQSLPPAANVSATDNCDDDVSVAMQVSSNGTCPEIITRTWTATDDCGNEISASQIITIIDTTPPTMQALHPFFGTIEHGDTLFADCTQIASLDSLGFSDSDNCGTSTRTFDETTMPGNCATDGYIELRHCGWTSTDECGNSDSLFFVVVISDLQLPIITGGVPADITVACGNIPPATAVITATDNCDDSLAITSADATVPGNCTSNYTIERTWSVADDCGNVATATQLITVEDMEPPVLVGTPDDTSADCGSIPIAPTVTATDNCAAPPVVSFDETINGGNCPYTITRTWTATDGCGNTTNYSQIITVNDDEAPIFAAINDTTVTCGNVPPMMTPPVSDNCDTSLVISEMELINASACDETITRTWIATDDCGNADTVIQIINVIDVVAPQITFNHPLLMGLTDGDTLNMECDNATIFSATDADATDDCSLLDLTFDENGVITGDCPVDGYLVQMSCSWIATDACGNADTVTLIMQIVDTNGPDFANIPADVTLSCGDTIPDFGSPTATDACGDVTMNFIQTEVPTAEGFDLIGTWTATDECGNESTLSQIIQVMENGQPVLVGVPNDTAIVISDGEIVPPLANVSAMDDCSGMSLNVEFASTFTVSPDGCDTTFMNTWTVEGTAVSASQTVEVINENCPCDNPVFLGASTSPELCGMSNGAAVVNIQQDPADFIWAWTPDLGTSIGAGNERNDLPEGNYMVIASNLICTDTFQVNIISDCDCLPAVVDSIATTEASCGGFDASATVELTGDESDYQYIWIPDLGTPNAVGNGRTDLPAAHYIVLMTYQGNTDCVEKVEFDVFDDCPRCPPMTDVVEVMNQSNETPAIVCLPVPFGAAVDLEILVNGDVYTDGIQGCDNQTVVVYDYSTAPGMAQSGSFYATWQHDGEVFSTVVQSMDELAGGMDFIDPAGEWRNDKKSFRLISTNLGGDYNGLALYHIPSETTTYHGPTETNAFLGLEMLLATGLNDVTLTNLDTDCSTDLAVNLAGPQEQIWEDDFTTVSGDCSAGNLSFCLGISELEIDEYEVSVDGAPFQDLFGGCDWDLTNFYGYSILNSFNAPFEVLNWTVDGEVYNGLIFNDFQELVDWMNSIDSNGDWDLDEAQFSLTISNSSGAYGALDIRHVATSSTVSMQPNTQQIATSLSIELEDGFHEISITRLSDGLTDTIEVLLACITTDVFEATIEIGETGTLCFDLGELPGELESIENLCDGGFGEAAIFEIDEETACVDFIGAETGETEACFVLCDEFGICDTVMASITVGSPTAVNETEFEDGLIIYNGFSPNGDGVNDFFRIDGLDRYPDHELTVYNRFGNRVFNAKDYRSDWGGSWGQNDMPNGTYFYVLTDGNGNRRMGYVQVKR